jgi:hypothetical protein
MNLNQVTTTNPAPKKPKADQTEFADARRACRTTTEREQLALIRRARWTSAELQEFAGLYYFKNGRDYPTPSSYRRAIADLARHYHGMTYTDTKASQYPHEWLRQFRKGGSKPLPPRREGLLIRGRGHQAAISQWEYSWPGHTEEFRAFIEQRCRDYFDIAPHQPVHVNAWEASQRAYQREESDLRRAAEDAKYSLLGKALKKSPPRGCKVVSSFSYVGRSFGDGSYTKSTLRPHFDREFKGHTPEFREEVTALARKDNHLGPRASVSRSRWQAACHRHFVLIERTKP